MAWEFLEKLKGQSAEIFNRIKDKPTFQRVVWAAYLIGSVDGEFDGEEKSKLVALIQKQFSSFDTKDILKAIEDAESHMDLDSTFGQNIILDEIGKSKGSDGAASIVRAAILIGGADGDFDDEEKAMTRKICDRLGIPAANYDL